MVAGTDTWGQKGVRVLRRGGSELLLRVEWHIVKYREVETSDTILMPLFLRFSQTFETFSFTNFVRLKQLK